MKVLLTVDATERWSAAARAVGRFVRARGGDVTVLTTLLRAKAREAAFAKAKRALALPDASVRTLFRAGVVENAVPAAVRDGTYDLVVVPPLGVRDWLTNGLLKNTLVRRIPTTTLVLAKHQEDIERILVCTQGPRHGNVNFDAAVLLAKVFDATLTVLHVQSSFALTDSGAAELERWSRDFLHADTAEARHLADLEGRMREAGVRGEVKVRFGLVVDEILAELEAGGADLLVVGAHHPGREGFLYQDMAGVLVRESPVSTLVVRNFDGASLARGGAVDAANLPPGGPRADGA